ncbi:MAG: hypothetical protein WAU60_05675 [Candidatus Competibacter denitrificans]|jgi:hypothetical protein
MIHRRTIKESNFDSVLHPTLSNQPARLIIRLKVRLFARDPSVSTITAGLVRHEHLARAMSEVRRGDVLDADGRRWRCRSWLESEFNAFCIKFKKVVELAWNNQLILIPPDGSDPSADISDEVYKEFISARNVPAHARCGLEIALVPFGNTSTAHALIEAVKLAEPSGHQFHSFQLRLTDEDVDFDRTIDEIGHSHYQITAAHEVGHWLGAPVSITDSGRYFNHVDAASCAADAHHERNADCEYGRTLSKRLAIMGLGTLATEYEARPWVTRAQRHTRVLFGWTVVHRLPFERGKIPVSARQKRLIK